MSDEPTQPAAQAALPELPPGTELVTLHSAGSIPGIPGEHGVGRYLVHLGERTIKRVEDWLEELARKKPAETEAAASEAAQTEAAPSAAPEVAPAAELTQEETPALAEDAASAAAEE